MKKVRCLLSHRRNTHIPTLCKREKRKSGRPNFCRALIIGGVSMCTLFACGQKGAKIAVSEDAGDLKGLLSKPDRKNVKTVDSEHALKEAIKKGGEEVNLTIPKGTAIRLSSVVLIEEGKEVNIEGEENVTIDGNKNTRLFEILPKATLRIKHVTLTGGTAIADDGEEAWGGAILNTGWLFVDDCIFRDNTAQAGGAIFNGNKKDTGGGLMLIGGSVFTGNSAELLGGAILNISNRSPVMIENSTFENNTAYSGGALYNMAGLVAVNWSFFALNKATQTGGAIHNDGGYLLINGKKDDQPDGKKSVFRNNEADQHGGAIANQKGGVYLLDGYVLSENTATWGGAVFNEEEGSIHLREVEIKGNAASKGEDIFNHSTGEKVIIENATAEKTHGSNFTHGKVDLSPFQKPE
ncbi:MAG: hypothetical protein LBD27_05210 [Tannerella sp.]|nr:hypothetical protein [Tannerella sp.]